ncbi:MAG: radical SAM protein [Deltaproteobacteria bacterium]|nr:radical SAM protein [Deltaproteobacteria bacterium]
MLELYENCSLCPRLCGSDRLGKEDGIGKKGFCGETHKLRVAYVGPHFGEEPPISGKTGSGTVFFAGCSLRCSFCQNHQISNEGLGGEITLEGLSKKLEDIILNDNVHNINFVTPDHFFPHVFLSVSILRANGFDLPIAYNLSGYQAIESLRIAEDFCDIYLPDFKYSDTSLAARLSSCADYPGIALGAIAEMVRQKGFLDSCLTDSDLARKGVLVRHLILPGKTENSINALTSLFLEFGPELPLSIMSQYFPVLEHRDKDMNRIISEEEFSRVYSHALDLGFENLFVQFPDSSSASGQEACSSFLPDFSKERPFG